jgi:4-amino-4-deoxy-L-arabinose transferase-like glycosyltransferase
VRRPLDRALNAVRAFWPVGTPGWILLALLLAGIVLRAFGSYAWSPTVDSLADAGAYARYATVNPLESPTHPAGYTAFLILVGAFTRDVAVTMVLQNLLGIASALLLFAATRRIVGSPWPALLPAAVVLLGADQVFLEHAVMSETLFTLVVGAGLYCCVRAMDAPEPWWRWPLAGGLLVGLSATVRSAGLFLVPVAVLALLLARPRPWLPRWRPVAALACAGVAVLVAYGAGNAATKDSFELGPSQGWHLYSRAASFADCDLFTPPSGSEGLCEEKPPSKRLGATWYLFHHRSPAVLEFGRIGVEDDLVGEWARRAILSQPWEYLSLVFRDFRAFFVPGWHGGPLYSGHGLDPSLDWRVRLQYVKGRYRETFPLTEESLEVFFDDFEIDTAPWALELLHDYQRVFRFGATALTVCTVLSLLGLLIGPTRRTRVAIFLYGVGGIALLFSPAIAGIYVGRYTVPVAGLMAVAAAIAIHSLWLRASARCRNGPGPLVV